ncbi:GNAT superfamily N-acetyltransferase [Lysobacter niastensis]|uniref:GNAT superfamily N-acetyltransferase n=1 Tax=Lysobacter niastensis TaxID=380629 RepID=A0ABU1WAF7_9GAMM|nr:GNAT family N-acetyltransferase [Lysobacter niastensis]MDR7134606.1 GNAT superfamily N-acetyltransferase [Lysobacter niastensis]
MPPGDVVDTKPLEIRANLQDALSDQDLARIHDFLARESYWAAGIPLDTLHRALRHSICYGGYVDGELIAFTRAVTDQATFAYLADVFVLASHRGQGHGRAIVAALMADERLHGLRRWHLVTRDMQALYTGLGFSALSQPESHMQKHDPDVYRRG